MWCTNQYSLKKIFEAIEDKKNLKNNLIQGFRLENTAISELEENVFGNYLVQDLYIRNATNLTRIHKNAFNSISHSFHKLLISGTPKLQNFPGTDYDLAKALDNLTSINHGRINLSKIDCSDCKMYWIIRDHMENHGLSALCDDNKSLFDQSLKSHWDSCKK